MVITILAIAFLILLIFAAIIGYKTLIGRQSMGSPNQIDTEMCTICRARFPKEKLVERQIGDYKVLYFCDKCVLGLSSDVGMKN